MAIRFKITLNRKIRDFFLPLRELRIKFYFYQEFESAFLLNPEKFILF